jgi:hypothetical protein
MAGAFDHGLHVVFPCHLRELAQRAQFGELRFVVGVGARAGAQAVAERESSRRTCFMMSQMSSKCV